jgi:hypothetical protein
MQAMIDKVASECVAVRLRMLNRVVTNIYDDALRSLDLKVSQMNIWSPPPRWVRLAPLKFANICISTFPPLAETSNE